MIKRKPEPQSLAQAMFVLAVCNKAQATFQAETCLMSHQSLSRQGIKRESLTAVEFGSRTPKSYNGSCENCKQLSFLFSIDVYFFNAILYKLYNPIVTVFKCQFVQQAGITKRLLLKLLA